MTRSPRRIAGAVAAVLGVILSVMALMAPPASADKPSDDAPADCAGMFNGSPDAQLTIASTPAGGAEVAVGDAIGVTLTWPTAAWEDISKVYVCVRVDGVMSPDTFVQKPGVNDGTESHQLTIPAGAAEVCVVGRVSGTPTTFNTSDDTHKSDTLCWPVGDGEQACEEGQLGTYPDCQDPECEEGQLGTYPDCQDPECEEGQLGTYPDCQESCDVNLQIAAVDEACGVCEEGQTGTFPDCQTPGCRVDCNPPPFDECPLITGVQPIGTDCTPPPPVDQCPDALNPGVQLDATLCNVPEIDVAVVVINPPAVQLPTEVQGEVISRTAPAQLPRTGTNTLPLLQLGLGLIVLGAGAMLLGRARTALI